MHSIVEYFSEHGYYKCGYCKRPDTNYSHGMWAHTLTTTDYQDLIDRGWRRSGKYCYKPTMDVTCCPMYTIRCRSQEFKSTKSQKKVLKRVNKYLLGEDVPSCGLGRKMSTCSTVTQVLGEGYEEGGEQFIEAMREHQDINLDTFRMAEVSELAGDGDQETRTISSEVMKIDNVESAVMKLGRKEEINKDTGPDPNKVPCKKAKLLRLERKLEKLREKGINTIPVNNTRKNKEKQIEDLVDELPGDVKYKLEIKLVRTNPPSPEWVATFQETHELYIKYQTTIHNDKPDKCSESKFREFLVTSPLLEEHKVNGPHCGYGSFHQQYWLDGKLIAVGVIDILPKCVSSVYFFYDPQYMHLSLGTYGALREIEFTRKLHNECPEIEFYYMGFYIHSCRKMRYKGNFYPSDLLCPETFKWFPLEDCIPKLETSPYSRLDPDLDSVDENYPKEVDVDSVPVRRNGAIMTFKQFIKSHTVKKEFARRHDDVVEYAALVGTKAGKRILLIR